MWMCDRAFVHIEKTQEDSLNDGINWDLPYVAVLAAVVGLVLWRFAGQALEHLGFRRI
jgi:hypothetical protein